MPSPLSNLRRVAAVAQPKQHIFLLSHMRAFTSLFGHIMGSNPAICGYYEMHIGYHSWKSLIRQKLLYFRAEEAKPGFTYMFDKILHNDHDTSLAVLQSPHVWPVFCLRHPAQTVPSILKLYARVEPNHAYNSEEFASQYYIDRLDELLRLARSLDGNFFYFDAESLKQDTDNCLQSLSDWLQLETPLSSNYELQKNTSKARYGDTSANLKAGHIIGKQSAYSEYEHNPTMLESTTQAYETARAYLASQSKHHNVLRSTRSGRLS